MASHPRRDATRKRPAFVHDAHVMTALVAAHDAMSSDPEDWTPSSLVAIEVWRRYG